MAEETHHLALDITHREAQFLVYAVEDLLGQAHAVKAEGFDIGDDFITVSTLLNHLKSRMWEAGFEKPRRK